MDSRSAALKVIAQIADVDIRQLPSLSPGDFSVSDWEWLEYATTVDIRESLMGAYRRAGANTVCPRCHRYATELFFQRNNRLPTVFLCGYENRVWYDTGADMVLVDHVLRKHNARLWCENG